MLVRPPMVLVMLTVDRKALTIVPPLFFQIGKLLCREATDAPSRSVTSTYEDME
jgi:hypothetical protein